MVGDIALRCRAVLDTLSHGSPTPHHLGSAGMLLRGAADDLVSLVELLDGPPPAADTEAHADAFTLSFDTVQGRRTSI